MVHFCNLICAYVNEKENFVSNWHYDHLCDLVHTYVDELKFMFQIRTVIFPMLLTMLFISLIYSSFLSLLCSHQ